MNKQRKVLIIITYNEMGIIVDTKAEEVAQTDLQPTCNNLATDVISRQTAIEALDKRFDSIPMEQTTEILQLRKDLRELPSAQPEHKTGKWILLDECSNSGYYCSECQKRLLKKVGAILLKRLSIALIAERRCKRQKNDKRRKKIHIVNVE